MKKIACFIFFSLFVSVAFSQTQEQRIAQAYYLTDSNFDIDCYAFKPSKNIQVYAKNKTRFTLNKLERDFSVHNNGSSTDILVSLSQHIEQEAQYTIKLENGEEYSGEIESNFKKGFYLNPSQTTTVKTFELDKLYCKINFAESKKIEITDSKNKYHINVHPHSNYDIYSETIASTQKVYEDKSFQSILLLEEKINGKGNLVDLSIFLDTGIIPNLPLNNFSTDIKVPSDSLITVSAAGHNRYNFINNNELVEITYTGGNHNYCIWNNTRNLITSLFRSESTVQLVINYYTDSIVAQRSGIIKGLSFKRKAMKKTRLLRNIFNNDLKTAVKYINNYSNYFENSFIKSSGFNAHYKTLTINTSSIKPAISRSIVLKGSGSRDLVINLNYL